MVFRLVYDITTEPAFDIEVVWLSGGFIGLGIIWRLVQRAKDSTSAAATADARKRIDPRSEAGASERGLPQRTGFTTPKILIIFGSLIALIGIGLMGWDHWRLVKAIKNGEAKVVEGPIQSWGTERVRTARTDKREYHLYERFYIGDSIWFGYYQDVGQAGFHNGKRDLVQLHDGIFARATYLYADGTDDPPRIVKLELADQP